MNINFIIYNGIKGYARVMYNDVKDADKYKIEVAYNGKDIKDLLEYLFKLESKIDKAIEFVESMEYCGQEDYFYDNKSKDPCGNDNTFNDSKNKLLDILKENK